MMANQPARIRQTDATKMMKAAKAAGYGRARVIAYPDGRIEIVGEDSPSLPVVEQSPFEKWSAKNAR